MALHAILASLPWSLILALVAGATVGAAYLRRRDIFEAFGFGTREVTFLTLLPVAGWAVHFPLLILGRSTLALNLGGALVPILLSAWVIHQGYLDEMALGVTAVGVAATAFVAYEIVRFDPSLGIVAEFPWFFLPPLAASGITLSLLARRDFQSVPAAYIAGSLGALIGADILHFGEIWPYMLSSPRAGVLSVGGAGPLDMVFLAGIVALAFNLVVVVLVNPERQVVEEPEPVGFRYPAGLELVHDPEAFVVDVDKRRVAGSYLPDRERARYHLARADLALAADRPERVAEEAGQAVEIALRRARSDGVLDDARRHGAFRDDVERFLDGGRRGSATDLTAAKLIVGALHRGGSS